MAAVVLAVGLLISLSEPYFYACSSCGSTWSDFSTDVSVLLAGALIVAAALPFLRLAGVARDHWTGRAVALNAAALVALVVVVFAPGVRGDFRLMREYSVQVPDIWRWSTHPARWIGAACAMGLVAAGMVLAYRAWRPQRVPE